MKIIAPGHLFVGPAHRDARGPDRLAGAGLQLDRGSRSEAP